MIKKITIKSDKKKTILFEALENSEIILEKNSDLTVVAILEKGWNTSQKINFQFKGENSVLNFIAIIIAKKDNNFPFETISNHISPHTKSFFHIRSVLFDQAQINYKGKIVINKTAQNTDTHLSHNNLSFSNEAKIQTIPSLEILADNVHAGHAAVVGKVDKNQIFYMQSRGIDQKTAEKLLTESFLKTDLDKIPDKKIKQFVINKLSRLK